MQRIRQTVEKEKLAKDITDCTEQIAELLNAGYTLELSTSRSGVKIYKYRKHREELRRIPEQQKRTPEQYC